MTISLAATDATQFLLAPLVRELHGLAPNLRIAGRPVQRLTKPEIDRLLATGQLDMVIGTPGLLPDDLRARVRQHRRLSVRDAEGPSVSRRGVDRRRLLPLRAHLRVAVRRATSVATSTWCSRR